MLRTEDVCAAVEANNHYLVHQLPIKPILEEYADKTATLFFYILQNKITK
jgi:hypothetical protein